MGDGARRLFVGIGPGRAAPVGVYPFLWLGDGAGWGKPGRGSGRGDEQAQPFALAAAAVPWPTTCLSRSLALCWFLRRQGVAAEVQLGVRPRPGGLEAHAWVVWQGAVLNDSPDVAQRYTPLSLPMAR